MINIFSKVKYLGLAVIFSGFIGGNLSGDEDYDSISSSEVRYDSTPLAYADYDPTPMPDAVEEGSGDPCCCLNETLPTDIDIARSCGKCGIWFPEDPPLFRPFVADPRQICFSAGWRFNDNALSKNTIPVSYGDSIAFYRLFDMGRIPGQLQIDLEGCLWAIFDPCTFSAPLINADYYGGIALTYQYMNWGARMRFYHISSHIGDEFLINHPDFDRRNPSAEYLDLFISNYLTKDIRVYGGVGLVLDQDESFHFGHWYAEAGMELHLTELGFFNYCNQIYGQPFYGMHYRFRPIFKKHLDMTYVLGYELGKTSGLERITRLFIEYHDGYSCEGEFTKFPTNYFSINLTYGY